MTQYNANAVRLAILKTCLQWARDHGEQQAANEVAKLIGEMT